MSTHPRKNPSCQNLFSNIYIYIYIYIHTYLYFYIHLFVYQFPCVYIHFFRRVAPLSSPPSYIPPIVLGCFVAHVGFPGLWLPAVLVVNLLVDPATTKKIKTGRTNQPHSNSSYFNSKDPRPKPTVNKGATSMFLLISSTLPNAFVPSATLSGVLGLCAKLFGLFGWMLLGLEKKRTYLYIYIYIIYIYIIYIYICYIAKMSPYPRKKTIVPKTLFQCVYIYICICIYIYIYE